VGCLLSEKPGVGKSLDGLLRKGSVDEQRDGSDFGEFYRTSKDSVYRSVLLATRQPERAEDAVAEAYARAFANWSRVSGHPAPIAWVVRTALNHFRSGWRIWRREAPEALDIVAIQPPAVGIEPDLLELLWHLPTRQREVIALRVLTDLDTRQTAAVLGIAPKTVTVHLHRALISLRTSLRGSEYEESA
jgi:RNA polymerase sigma factor (sigma-70 family)